MSNSEEKTRTLQQNKSLHLFYTHLAEALNDSGNDMRKTLKETVDIPWSADSVKRFLWRPIQEAQIGKESTTELNTKEIDMVYDTLNRHLGSKLGVHVPFPSVEEIVLQNKLKDKRG